MDSTTTRSKNIPGNYTDYLEAKQREQERQWNTYRDQEVEIQRMKTDINRTKQQSLYVEMTTKPNQPGVRRIAKKVAVKAKSREKKLNRYLKSDERVDKPTQGWQMKLDLGAPEHESKDVLVTESLSIGYALESPLLVNLNVFIRAGQRVVLTGPNGAGKTSFIRTVIGKIPPLTGSFRLGGATKLGYMAQEQELLNPNFSALQMIQSISSFNETDARNFLHYFLFKGDIALRPSHELSFGERARLQLATLVAQGCTFLILDEPINHLDIPSRERFEEALENFNGTILAVVHDRSFMKVPSAEAKLPQTVSEFWLCKRIGKMERYENFLSRIIALLRSSQGFNNINYKLSGTFSVRLCGSKWISKALVYQSST
ncbi:MAG: ABC-F family ATP-binding cassette domain-containing protein [Anaerolineales bacterium]|uniref:ATP-binding cassette domain-containing protein n=1 Tax=Candidatus Villigracilis proximus TaxID=3140683 RepID=UPI0031373FC5|nr:ABC-F family ATP-binding cassette domain-containing protein [Anaerolineales bacterium]